MAPSDKTGYGDASLGRRKGLGRNWVTADLPEWPWELLVDTEMIDGAPQIVAIALLPKDDRRPRHERIVRSERLRRLPLRRLRSAAVTMPGRMNFTSHSPADLEAALAAMDELQQRSRRPGAPLPADHFAQVAETYRAATATGVAPRKAIEERWGVSRAAASKWIRQARERGLLGWPSRRGVAGTEASKSPNEGEGR